MKKIFHVLSRYATLFFFFFFLKMQSSWVEVFFYNCTHNTLHCLFFLTRSFRIFYCGWWFVVVFLFAAAAAVTCTCDVLWCYDVGVVYVCILIILHTLCINIHTHRHARIYTIHHYSHYQIRVGSARKENFIDFFFCESSTFNTHNKLTLKWEFLISSGAIEWRSTLNKWFTTH